MVDHEDGIESLLRDLARPDTVDSFGNSWRAHCTCGHVFTDHAIHGRWHDECQADDCDCSWFSLGDPVGLEEIAARLGVQRPTVDQWRQRGVLPAPAWTVGGRPAWPWPVIEDWARLTGRLPGEASKWVR